MKLPLLISFVCCFLTISCNRNPLKTNEDKLVKQILSEEEQLAYEAKLRKEREQQLADSIAKLPKGFQFQENRQVDPQIKPRLINIASQRTDTINLLLSDVVKSVEYIRLDPIPDTSKLMNAKLSVRLTPKYIVAYGASGIYLYNRSGKYIKTIIKNSIKGMGFSKSGGYGWRGRVNYRGSIGEVWILGDNIYFTTRDREKNKYSYRQLNIENTNVLISPSPSIENPLPDFPGKEIARFTPKQAEGFDKRLAHVATTIPMGENMFINVPSAWGMSSKGMGLGIYGKGFDTICQFSNYNVLQNFSRRLIDRGRTTNKRYFFRGQLFVYPMFSDTIFKIEPPNRMIPAYVFNFGEYHPTPNEYFVAGPLNGKMCLSDKITETPDKLFFEYQDIDGVKKIGIYNKQTGRFFHVSNCKRTLPDDVDGVLNYWPGALNSKYEEGKTYFASILKNYIDKNKFNLPESYANQETIDFINQLGEDDRVLIIYKLK